MKNIKLAGVPEHFNLPWHIAYEESVFESLNIDLEFIDYPGGTGAMGKALLNSEVDMALLLTEGAVKFISENPEYKIIKTYVQSPLIWGVHTPSTSVVTDSSDLHNLPFAISRYGSGSHLMAYVYAQSKGLDLNQLQFEIIKNLDGLRENYKNGLDALFLWEKFTTKPFVDNAEMKRVDTCPTPWPCFVLVAHQDFIQKESNSINDFVDAINIVLDSFKDRNGITQEISERYELQLKDVEEWFADTEYNSSLDINKSMLQNVIDTLSNLEILKIKIKPEELISIITNLK